MAKSNEPKWNEIKLDGVNIFEPNDERNVSVTVDIPYTFYLCGNRPKEEYREHIKDELRQQGSKFFEIVKYFGYQLAMGNSDESSEFGEFIVTCGLFGHGCLEVLEFIDNIFDRDEKKKTDSAPDEKPLDLSEVSTEHPQTDDCDEIAEQLSKVLNNPKLPAELYNAIHHGLDEIGNNASPSALTRLENKPEYIKEFLRDAILDCSEMPSERA